MEYLGKNGAGYRSDEALHGVIVVLTFALCEARNNGRFCSTEDVTLHPDTGLRMC